MKYWIIFFTTLVLLITSKVYALDTASTFGQPSAPDQAAKKYGIIFPVAELGNCANLSECKNYCEDPQNHDACVNFARKKGFYREEKTAIHSAILNAAKAELGCESDDSCKSFCGQQANWEKCGEFAKKHNLSGGQVEDPAKKEILAKAKEVLGCDSYNGCKNICTKEENKQKCDDFAKLVGLRGGVEKRGPGGCTTEDSCKKFCSDPTNSKLCTQYASSLGQKFSPPQNIQTAITTYDYQELCTKTPNCTWINNNCSCGTPISSPPPSYSPYPSSSGSCYPPPNGCGQYYYWDVSSCSCKSYADKCKSYGCNWTGTTCQCSTTQSSTPYPALSPTHTPTLSTSSNTGTYSSVKGVSTVRTLLQKVLDFFR